jgi:hypothetical protein
MREEGGRRRFDALFGRRSEIGLLTRRWDVGRKARKKGEMRCAGR